jgi:proline iminopeptidase
MPPGNRHHLYPVIEPYAQARMKVGGGHEIYYEECGNPRGKPVLIVHGGPGGGTNGTMRRFHDPARYRIIMFDQRGCGRSTPHASLEANTTWDLVDDMEQLRARLDIDRWQLFGGSWGSTLSLAYGIRHPERVSDMVLRGIFLLRRSELDWFYGPEGCRWLFPDAYAAFEAVIPPAERGDMIAAYYRRLTHADRRVQIEAARAWSVYEGSTLSLIQDAERLKLFASDSYAIAFARIECHYFVNGGFLRHDDDLLRHAGRLRRIPCTVVHGRYDVVTPLRNAFDLQAVWREIELKIIPDAGHAMTEPNVIDALVRATRRYSGLQD